MTTGFTKYHYDRTTPEEFSELLRESGISIDGFMYLSGRKRPQIMNFLDGSRDDFTPLMADCMLLELACADKTLVPLMFEIVEKNYAQETDKPPVELIRLARESKPEGEPSS